MADRMVSDVESAGWITGSQDLLLESSTREDMKAVLLGRLVAERDPSETLVRIQNYYRNENGGDLQQDICFTLANSINYILEVRDSYNDGIVQNIMQHVIFFIGAFVESLGSEKHQVFLEVFNNLIMVGIRSEFFKSHGMFLTNSTEALSFIRSSKFCYNDFGHDLDTEPRSLPILYFRMIEFVCEKGSLEKMCHVIKSNVISPALLFSYLTIIGNLFDVLQLQYKKKLGTEQLCDTVSNYLLHLSNKDIKVLSRVLLVEILSQFNAILRKGECDVPAKQIIESIRREIALRQVKCPFMQQRLSGLKEIRLFIESVEETRPTRASPFGTKRLLLLENEEAAKKSKLSTSSFDEDDDDESLGRLSTPGDDFSSDGDVPSPKPVSKLSPSEDKDTQDLLQWFRDVQFIQLLFSPGFIHVELLKRSSDICRFLSVENFLTQGDLDLIWDTAHNSNVHESIKDSVMQVITEIAKSLSLEMLNYTWMKFQNMPLEFIDLKFLFLVRTFTVNAVNSAAFKSSAHESIQDWFGLLFLWRLVQDDCSVSSQIHKVSLQYLIDLCSWAPCFPVREYFLNCCVDNLKCSKSVPQSLKLFRRVVSSFPIRGGASQSGQDIKYVDDVVGEMQEMLVDACLNDLERYKHECQKVCESNSYLRQHLLFLKESTCESMDEPEKSDTPEAILDDEIEDEGIELTDDIEAIFLGRTKMDDSLVRDTNPINSVIIVGKYSHLKSLRIRLTFLQFVLISRDAGIQLSTEQVSLLFFNLAKSPLTDLERELGFSWLMQIHYVANVFSKETARDSLLVWLRSLPLAAIHQRAFAFFTYFFRVVNIEYERATKTTVVRPDVTDAKLMKMPSIIDYRGASKKFTAESQDFSVLSPHLYGVGMLWSIALFAPGDAVSRTAADFLCSCYLSMDEFTDPEMSLDDVVDAEEKEFVSLSWSPHTMIRGGFTREALAQLKRALDTKSSSSKSIVRCIYILNNLQESCKHNSGDTHGYMVKRINQLSGILTPEPETIRVRVKPMETPEFQLQMLKHSTIIEFSVLVAKQLSVKPTMLRFICSGKELKSETESEFYENQFIHVVTRPADSSTSMETDEKPIHRPADILKETENLKLVTELVFSISPVEGLSSSTWALLMDLPTDPDILARVRADGISAVRLGQSPYKLLYILQIVHMLLEEEDGELVATFISKRGIESVVAAFASTITQVAPIEEHQLEGYCLLLLIFIMKKLPILETSKLSTMLLQAVTIVASSSSPDTTTAMIGKDIIRQALQLRSKIVVVPFPSPSDSERFKFESEWLRHSLLQSPNEQAKRYVCQFMMEVQSVDLLEALISFLPDTQTEEYFLRSKEFFLLLDSLISHLVIHQLPQVVQRDLLKRLLTSLREHDRLESGLPNLEETFNQTLVGLFQVVTTIIRESAFKDTMLCETIGSSDICSHVFNSCLFEVTRSVNNESFRLPSCSSVATREAAFEFLLECIKISDDIGMQIFEMIESQHLQTQMAPTILKPLITLGTKCYSNDNVRDRERLWNYVPSSQRKSSSGYVGLRNMGCICYMNSLLQQLFMIPELRETLFRVKTIKAKPVDDISKNRLELVLQLKDMFCNLQESKKKSYDMVDFCEKCIVLNHSRPVDIFEQQDVDEFFNTLMDQLELALDNTNAANTLRETFGGVLCNQIICKEGCSHISERKEQIMVCQLEVKGKRSIKESLDLYVEGEMLEGENKYLCGECNEKRDAQKRACFSELPNILILHLKRFEFDLELLRKIKVNDHCEFPMTLDMTKYTLEGLEGGDNLKSNDYYTYDLVGILVHSGTSDSGHYYSYIKDRFDPENWLFFNDSEVSTFDPSSIPQSCFGGLECSMKWDSSQCKHVQQWIPKHFSAYLLIYERKQFSMARKPDLQTTLSNAVPRDLFHNCWKENVEFINDEYVFDPLYVEFMASAAHYVRGKLACSKPLYKKSLESFVSLGLNTLVHGLDKLAFSNSMNYMKRVAEMNPEESRLILLNLFESNGGTTIKQLLLRCPIALFRDTFLRLLKPLVTENLQEERSKYFQVDESLAQMYSSTRMYRAFCGSRFDPVDLDSPLESIEDLGEIMWAKCLRIPCVPPVCSSVARIIGWMLGFLTEASSYWKNYEQFFLLLLSYAKAGPAELQLLIDLGAIPRIIDCLTWEESPAYLANQMDDVMYMRHAIADKHHHQPKNSVIAKLICYLICEADCLSQLDVNVILHTSALTHLLYSNIEPTDVSYICLHLSNQNLSNSKSIIHRLVTGLKQIPEEYLGNAFVVLESCLEIQTDEFQNERVSFAVEILLKTVKESRSTSFYPTFCVAKLCCLVLGKRLPRLNKWLLGHKSDWVVPLVVSHECPNVRRFASNLISILFFTTIHERRRIFKYLVNLLDSKFLSPFITGEYYSSVEASASKLPQTTCDSTGGTSLELSERMLSEFPVIKDILLHVQAADADIRAPVRQAVLCPNEPPCFQLSRLFFIMALMMEHHIELESLVQSGHFAIMLQLLVRLDSFRLECDWNKGSLIVLLQKVLELGPRFVMQWLQHDSFEKLVNVAMTVRATEELYQYNELFAPPYYKIFCSLTYIGGNSAAVKLSQLQHLIWAIRYYVLDICEFPLTCAPLLTVSRKVAAVSPDFRSKMMSCIFPDQLDTIHGSLALSLRNRVSMLRCVLGLKEGMEEGDSKILFEFVTFNGFVWLSRIINRQLVFLSALIYRAKPSDVHDSCEALLSCVKRLSLVEFEVGDSETKRFEILEDWHNKAEVLGSLLEYSLFTNHDLNQSVCHCISLVLDMGAVEWIPSMVALLLDRFKSKSKSKEAPVNHIFVTRNATLLHVLFEKVKRIPKPNPKIRQCELNIAESLMYWAIDLKTQAESLDLVSEITLDIISATGTSDYLSVPASLYLQAFGEEKVTVLQSAPCAKRLYTLLCEMFPQVINQAREVVDI